MIIVKLRRIKMAKKFSKYELDPFDKIYSFDQIAESTGLDPTELYDLMKHLGINATYKGVTDNKGYFSEKAYKTIRKSVKDRINKDILNAINKEGYYAYFQIIDKLKEQGYKVKAEMLRRMVKQKQIKSKQFSEHPGSFRFVTKRDAEKLLQVIRKKMDTALTINNEKTFAPVKRITKTKLQQLEDKSEIISIDEMCRETGFISSVFKIAFGKAEINPAYFCIDTQTYYYNRISYEYILKRLLQQRKITM